MIPSVTIDNPSSVLLNESFEATFNFKNSSGPIGFKPFLDVLIPRGIVVSGVTKVGTWDTDASVWKDSDDTVITVHPKGSAVSLPSDPGSEYDWFCFESIYSSYGPDQPETTIKTLTCVCDKTAGAAIGTTQSIRAIPWFRYGQDALDNPETDPPVAGTLVSSEVTP